MLWDYLAHEKRKAAAQGRPALRRLRARNTLILVALMTAPLSAGMWVLLLLWAKVTDVTPTEPGQLMLEAAFTYPLMALAGLLIGVTLYRRCMPTGALVCAALPLVCVPVYLFGLLQWLLE